MHRFLSACLRRPVDRTPVWMMRQAGRYLPAYRAVRSRTSFLGLCTSPDLACEVTLQPIDEFGMDAAILFSDILIPLQAMGMRLDFTEHGPSLAEPLRGRDQVERLGVPDPEETMPFVTEAVRRIRRALAERVPLIGFAGAPFTLATYAVEGGGSKDFAALKRMMFSDPQTTHALLGKLTRTVARLLAAQVAAGAQAVQIFDTWASVLSPVDFEEFALRWTRELVAELRAQPSFGSAEAPVPIIYYMNGCAPYLDFIRQINADVVGVDWRIDIGVVRRRLGTHVALQGNLDPTVLFGPPDYIDGRVAAIIRAAGPGHIFNLGHGVLPETDPEHVRAMVGAVHRHGKADQVGA